MIHGRSESANLFGRSRRPFEEKLKPPRLQAPLIGPGIGIQSHGIISRLDTKSGHGDNWIITRRVPHLGLADQERPHFSTAAIYTSRFIPDFDRQATCRPLLIKTGVFMRWSRLIKLSTKIKEDCEKGGFDPSKPDDSKQSPVWSQ
jgi:hypothetical protein